MPRLLEKVSPPPTCTRVRDLPGSPDGLLVDAINEYLAAMQLDTLPKQPGSAALHAALQRLSERQRAYQIVGVDSWARWLDHPRNLLWELRLRMAATPSLDEQGAV